jgi:hypothetical protein
VKATSCSWGVQLFLPKYTVFQMIQEKPGCCRATLKLPFIRIDFLKLWNQESRSGVEAISASGSVALLYTNRQERLNDLECIASSLYRPWSSSSSSSSLELLFECADEARRKNPFTKTCCTSSYLVSMPLLIDDLDHHLCIVPA